MRLLPTLISAVTLAYSIPASAYYRNAYVDNSDSNLTRYDNYAGKATGALCYTGDQNWGDSDPTWIMGVFAGRTCFFSIPLFPQTSTLATAASGGGNLYYKQWAQEILAKGVPAPDGNFYVRTAWELGGNWFWWSSQANNNPTQLKQAFCQFANTFHSVSNKFKIVWDVAAGQGDVSKFYPGDSCVNGVSQDFYWNPQWDTTNPTTAFNSKTNASSYGLQWIVTFAAQHKKFVAYSEWGVPNQADGGYSVGQSACNTYISLVHQWFVNHPTKYQTVWDSDAGGYDGRLSTGNSQCSVPYKTYF